jgi:hypothetical protein
MANEPVAPHGCTWGRYLEQLTAEHGGWTALTHLLIRRAGPKAELPADPGSIERALRRLRTKGNGPGGQYGRWLLKHFGVPRPLADAARWMGQYHSRFSDLALSVRESQLWLWDRPPIAESALACWVHLGLASVALSRGELAAALERQAKAARLAGDDVARLEASLLEARLTMEAKDAAATAAALDRAAVLLDRLPAGLEADCYRARWCDQRAYWLLHGPGPRRLREGWALYASIDEHSSSPFARFRREHGLAYCEWKLGHRSRAIAHARAAAENAADAGMLRFRAQALGLLAHLVPAKEAKALRARVAAIGRELEVR